MKLKDHKTCIICREIKNDFNIEHVIPYALGGRYEIDNVCVDCNSNMGTKVDIGLTTSPFAEIFREQYKLKSNSGAVPSFLSGTYPFKDVPHLQARLIDKNGQYQPFIVPHKDEKDIDEHKKEVSYTLDASDKKSLNRIIDKLEKEHGVDRNDIINNLTEGEITAPLSKRVVFDFNSINLGLLKIAYEFTVDCVDGYFDTNDAKEISSILLKADKESLEKIRLLNFEGMEEVKKLFSPLLSFDEHKHYLILQDLPKQGLVCYIFMGSMSIYSLGIPMTSINGLIDGMVILVNDVERKSVKKFIGLSEILSNCSGRSKYSFCYLFDSEEEGRNFYNDEAQGNIEPFKEEGRIPLFSINGDKVYSCFTDALSQFNGRQISFNENEFVFNEDVFIRFLPMNRLVKLLAVRELVERNML